jgi:transcriptional regulator with XRE-family HTH domain
MTDLRLVAVGQRIREIRKAKGLTQEGLALLSGIDRGYMGHIERGEKNATLITVFTICEALGISPKDLFSGS